MNREFEILHISARPRSDDRGNKWLIFNLVLKSFDEDLTRSLQQATQEYIRSHLAQDMDLLEKYHDGLHMDLEPIPGSNYRRSVFSNKNNLEFEDVWTPGWINNPTGDYLNYIEKFDVYHMREYLEDNPTVRGTLDQIKLLQNGESKSRFADWGQLVRCLETLNLWWD